VALVAGLGASPGQTNIMARHLADQIEEVEEIRFFLVNDLRYRSEAVWHHRFSMFGGPALIYDDGEWKHVPGMADGEDIEFPEPWGTVRCYTVGLEPITLPNSIRTVRHASMKRGFLHPAMGQMLRDYIRYGLTSQAPIQVGGLSVAPASFAAAHLAHSTTDHLFEFDSLPGELPRQVRVKGTRMGQPAQLTMTYSHPSNNIPLATASCLVVGARMLVSGEVPGPGLWPPEALDPAPFLRDMESSGVTLRLDRE
jgi:saccharopine dehydrogenase-like NADP-dependent oxidoreductase